MWVCKPTVISPFPVVRTCLVPKETSNANVVVGSVLPVVRSSLPKCLGHGNLETYYISVCVIMPPSCRRTCCRTALEVAHRPRGYTVSGG